MNIKNRFRHAASILYSVVRRFPVSLFMSSAVAFIMIFIIHEGVNISSSTLEIIQRLTAVFALGFPLSLCITMLFERNTVVKPVYMVLAHFLGIGALLLYYIFVLVDFRMVSITRYVGTSLILYLTFLFIPFFYNKENFELYVIRIFTRFFVTLIYSVVLYAGLAAIIFTINKLLGIPVKGELYADIGLIVAGVFAPAYLLGDIPAKNDELDVSGYPKLLKVLLIYIVMPILAAYTFILYIYFAKIIIIMQWPVGLVAHLVLWYSVITTVVVFFVLPLFKENKWINMFVTWISRIIIPLMAIMFISIGIRIKAYGVTENRYFVVLLGVWTTAVMFYIVFSRNKRSILLPILLALLTLIGICGPASAYNISIHSQTYRFACILKKYDMLTDGKHIKPSSAVSKSDKIEISSIMDYFADNHNLDQLEYLPKGFKISDMEKVLGFSSQDLYNAQNKNEYFSYYAGLQSDKPVTISGYDYMFTYRGYSGNVTQKDSNIKIQYSSENTTFSITIDGQKIYAKDMSEYVKGIYDKLGVSNKSEIPLDDLTYIDENNNIKIKFVLTGINGYVDNISGKINIQSIEFMAFLKTITK